MRSFLESSLTSPVRLVHQPIGVYGLHAVLFFDNHGDAEIHLPKLNNKLAFLSFSFGYLISFIH